MDRFRFVHAADLHLDTAFEGIGRTAPHVADALREASLEAWDGLVRLTIEQRALFLLIAGDIYDGATRGVRAQLRFCQGLQRLADHNIRVFIVHGNHDPLDGWSAIRNWPAGVTVFGSDRVEAVGVDRNGVRVATIYGVSYPHRDVGENLSLRFQRGPEPGIHIGLLHCNVGGHPEHAAYSPCSFEDLQRSGLDYWALGHVHRHQVTYEDRQTIVYPGCLQGRSARSCDEGSKGAVIIEADENGVRSMEFAPLDRLRFIGREIDVSEVEDLRGLQQLLVDVAAETRELHRPAGVLLKVILTGRSEVHRDLSRQGVLSELLKTLREEFSSGDPLLWWVSIDDHSGLTIDLEAISRRGDFSSELLRYSQQVQHDPPRLGEILGSALDPLHRVGLPAPVREELEALDPVLLRDATQLALDLLEEE